MREPNRNTPREKSFSEVQRRTRTPDQEKWCALRQDADRSQSQGHNRIMRTNRRFGRIQVHPKPLSSQTCKFHPKPLSSQKQFHPKPISSQKNDFDERTTANKSKNNVVRVCVKASPGRRPETAFTQTRLIARLSVSTGPSCEASPAEDASHEGPLKPDRRKFRCLGVLGV